MNKTIKFLTTLLLLAVSVGAWADTYKLVTSASELSQGDVIVIANAASGTNGRLMVMGPQSGNNCPAKEAYITDDEITNLQDGQEVTLESVNNNNQFSFKVGNGTYLYAASSSNNYLKTQETEAFWSITIDSSSHSATIKDVTSNKTRNILRYNLNSSLFSCYASGQQDVYIFKKQVDSNLEQNDLALSGSTALSFDLYNNSNSQTISYTTSSTGAVTVGNSGYATFTVDQTAKTITVTPTAVTPSVQTITVSQAADETYAAGSATFTVNITNSEPVIDYATLPFEYDGNATETLPSGLTQYGLGTKTYSLSPKIGFDTTGDYLLLKINEAPGTLTYDIKGNGFSGGTFKVQTSEDGTTYTDLETYTELGDTQSESFENLAADVRYIKWIYTNKSSGNVALGNIKLEKYVEPSHDPVINASDINLSYGSTSGNISCDVTNPVSDGVLSASTNSGWLTVSNSLGDIVYSATENTTAAERTATVTLTYTYNTNQTVTKEITVTQAGNPNHPYTVAQAIAATPSTGNVCIHGIVSSFYKTSIVDDGSNYRYYISDDGSTGTQLLVYKGKDINQNAFDDANDLLKGDEVIIYGKLITYNDAPEVAADNYIVSKFRKELNYITLSGNYPTTFVEGREFSHEGIVVTAHYNDDSTMDVTENAAFSEPDMTQIGVQTVTVSFNGKSVNYTITITEAPSHTATFSVNGEIISTATVTVKEGVAITFPTEVNVPEGYTFTGWVAAPIAGTQATAPEYVTSATMGESDVTFYAVLAEGTSSQVWEKLEANQISEEGTYALISAAGYAFNGTITSGHGQSTTDAFSFTNDVAETAPEGTCELTLTVSGEGFTMYNADHGYLYATKAGSGGLAWQGAEDSYWHYDAENWTYAYNKAYLRVYNNTFRTYGTNTNQSLYFAHYTTIGTYSNYCTTIPVPVNDIVITSALWATYVPNQAVTIPEAVTAYIVTNATSTSVTLSSVASAPANTGLVVNGAQGTYTPTAAETTDDVSDNKLVVSNGSVTGDGATIYALGNKGGTVGFKRVANGVNVPAGKPYLTIESSGSKDFFDFSFDEGVATGIESVESVGFDMNAPVYDLQGRQVNRLYKGIFIQNGKKIIVK